MWDGGPEHPAAVLTRLGAPGQHEQRGQEGHGGEQRRSDADGADRPEALGRLQLAEQQAEQAEDHRAGGRGDRLDGAAPREPHRLVPVVVPAQFLAVPGDEQQGVVRRRADDEDREDALALPVELDEVVLRQVVDDHAREREREERRRQHEERHDRTAVDDEQDHQDGDEGDEEQHAVDARERLDEVGDGAGRARHVDGGPAHVEPLVGRTQGLDRRLDRVRAVGQRGEGQIGVEVEDGERGLAVLGGDDGDRPRHEEVADLLRRGTLDRHLDRRDPLRELLERLQLGRRQRGVALEQHESGERLLRGERGLLVEDRRRLGVLRAGTTRCRSAGPRTACPSTGRRPPRWRARRSGGRRATTSAAAGPWSARGSRSRARSSSQPTSIPELLPGRPTR